MLNQVQHDNIGFENIRGKFSVSAILKFEIRISKLENKFKIQMIKLIKQSFSCFGFGIFWSFDTVSNFDLLVSHRGELSEAPPARVHLVKSIS